MAVYRGQTLLVLGPATEWFEDRVVRAVVVSVGCPIGVSVSVLLLRLNSHRLVKLYDACGRSVNNSS